MSNISMVEAKLPPGFRFHPRDDELVCDYLLTKIAALGSSNDSLLLLEVDLNKSEPWQIPDAACIGGKEWYFYSLRDRKYATGSRTNRATATGYWKATGKDRSIFRKGRLVGMRKTLVFYQGRAPKGRKTDWVMHEFRVEGPHGPPNMPSSKEDWVLCRVFFKNRDHVAKASTGMGILSYEVDDKGNGLCLPPLMDSLVTTTTSLDLDHTNNTNDSIIIDHHQYDEQVPCFSIFSSQHQLQPPLIPNPFGLFPPHVEMMDNVASTGSCNYVDTNYTPTSGNKVLKAVLNHLTKDQNPNNNNNHVKDQNHTTSSDSFLSQVAGMWSHY